MVNSDPAIGSGRRRPLLSGSPSSICWQTTPVSTPVLGDKTDGRGEDAQLRALLLGLVHLLGGGRHLGPGAPVGYRDLASSQAQ